MRIQTFFEQGNEYSPTLKWDFTGGNSVISILSSTPVYYCELCSLCTCCEQLTYVAAGLCGFTQLN